MLKISIKNKQMSFVCRICLTSLIHYTFHLIEKDKTSDYNFKGVKTHAIEVSQRSVSCLTLFPTICVMFNLVPNDLCHV